jgi:NTF2 fold immunity protein
MKKSFLFLFFYFTIQTYCTGQNAEQEAMQLRDFYEGFNYVPDSGCVKNKYTAIKLAKVILESIYGEESMTELTFEAILIENKSIWLVFGKLPLDTLGGNPYIEIRKRDGLILKVANSK